MMRRAMVLLLAAVFMMLLVSSTALAANGNGNSKCESDCAGGYSWVRRGRGNG
ncbi:MAG TPA: hypothetical protein VK464_24675 [Symbiobacteriaceae bacterium]|jgi:hypothetical protein|nr:hypothetical protein [Symbiobacteriaceae bacterium]